MDIKHYLLTKITFVEPLKKTKPKIKANMKKIYLILIIVLFSITFMFSQHQVSKAEIKSKSFLKIEATTGTTINTGNGMFYSIDLGNKKEEKPYSFIITKKSLIKNASEIVLFFNEANGSGKEGKIYKMKIPNNKDFVIQHPDAKEDLVAIPLGQLRAELDNANFKIDPLFLTGDYISNFSAAITEKDLLAIKEIMMARIKS